jgi:hypothetical protein
MVRAAAILALVALTGCWKNYTFVDVEEAGPHALPMDAGLDEGSGGDEGAGGDDLAALEDVGDDVAGPNVPLDGSSGTIELRPGSVSLMVGYGTAILEISLGRAAGPGGQSVSLASTAPGLLIPTMVVVPEGRSSVGFRVRALGASPGAITASLPAPNPALATASVSFVGTARAPFADELVINEVNYDVPTVNGDANCDGTTSAFGDEFIELANRSNHPLQLEGVTLWDEFGFSENKPRFIFNAHALGSGETVVVFGGTLGMRMSTAPWCQAFWMSWIGDALILPNPQGFNLDNTGDTIHLTATPDRTSGNLADPVVLPPGANQSWTRSPDFTGPFVKHGEAPGHATDRRWTPGTLLTGEPFAAASP